MGPDRPSLPSEAAAVDPPWVPILGSGLCPAISLALPDLVPVGRVVGAGSGILPISVPRVVRPGRDPAAFTASACGINADDDPRVSLGAAGPGVIIGMGRPVAYCTEIENRSYPWGRILSCDWRPARG